MDVAAVPGIAGVVGVTLRAPGGVGLDLLPAVLAGRVFDAGLGPGKVVAQVELPCSVDRERAFAEGFGDKRTRGGGSRLLQGCGAGTHWDANGEQGNAERRQACQRRTYRGMRKRITRMRGTETGEMVG